MFNKYTIGFMELAIDRFSTYRYYNRDGRVFQQKLAEGSLTRSISSL